MVSYMLPPSLRTILELWNTDPISLDQEDEDKHSKTQMNEQKLQRIATILNKRCEVLVGCSGSDRVFGNLLELYAKAFRQLLKAVKRCPLPFRILIFT